MKLIISAISLVGLPLLGFLLSGQPIEPLIEFPPVTVTVTHAPFSWPVFALFSLVTLGLFAGLVFLLFSGTSIPALPTTQHSPTCFPWWGWTSFIALLTFWLLAWTRFPWFADFQGFTFTPLWISFIVVLNALSQQRTGQCLLVHQPRFFLSLFGWSAVFWWYFEYLNRFVQNWRYIGIEPMTALDYGLHSTIAFSTVLPAVWSASHLLGTFSFFSYRTQPYPLGLAQQGKVAWGIALLSGLCLIGLPILPNYLFPFLWIAPLLLMLGLQMRCGNSFVVSALGEGRWQVITIPASAALLCGFFWEMWNFNSAAKWVYTIPFVDRFHLFEMPLLGYAGYLPFGVECVVAVDFLTNGRQCFEIMGWSNNRG